MLYFASPNCLGADYGSRHYTICIKKFNVMVFSISLKATLVRYFYNKANKSWMDFTICFWTSDGYKGTRI